MLNPTPNARSLAFAAILVFGALFALSGCNTSSAVLVGTSRAPIAPEQVKIYDQPPANFEVVAIIDATGKTGWTDQRKMDGAIAALREKAAALGANGVIIEKVFDQMTTYQGNSGTEKKVHGRAIFVRE